MMFFNKLSFRWNCPSGSLDVLNGVNKILLFRNSYILFFEDEFDNLFLSY